MSTVVSQGPLLLRPGEIAPIAPEELDSLAQFLSQWAGAPLPSAVWRRRFDLWWTNNPYFATSATRGFVIKDNGRICGFFGLLPMGFQLGGKQTLVYAATTWLVDPLFRHRSLAALSQVLRYVRGSLLFTWTGNTDLIRILEAVKFVPLPRPHFFYQRQPSTVLLRLDRFRPRTLTLLSPFATGHATAVLIQLRLHARGLEVRRLSRADEIVDKFWERTREQAKNTNPRTSTFLNWHCFSSLDFLKRLYGCYQDGHLTGLLVAYETRPRGGRMLSCADVWVDPDVRGVLDALLARLCTDAWRDGLDGVELPPYSQAILRFSRRRAFLPRRTMPYPEYVLGPSDAVALLESPSTYLCGLQGDRFL